MVYIIWLVLSGDGYILAGKEWWWMLVVGGIV